MPCTQLRSKAFTITSDTAMLVLIYQALTLTSAYRRYGQTDILLCGVPDGL